MKKSKDICLVLITAIALSGCGDNTDKSDPNKDKDADGQVITPAPNSGSGQVNTYHGGGFYPWFFRSSYYGSGIYSGPEHSFSGISPSSKYSSSPYISSSRGSFASRSSGFSGGSISRGGFGGSFSGGFGE